MINSLPPGTMAHEIAVIYFVVISGYVKIVPGGSREYSLFERSDQDGITMGSAGSIPVHRIAMHYKDVSETAIQRCIEGCQSLWRDGGDTGNGQDDCRPGSDGEKIRSQSSL